MARKKVSGRGLREHPPPFYGQCPNACSMNLRRASLRQRLHSYLKETGMRLYRVPLFLHLLHLFRRLLNDAGMTMG